MFKEELKGLKELKRVLEREKQVKIRNYPFNLENLFYEVIRSLKEEGKLSNDFPSIWELGLASVADAHSEVGSDLFKKWLEFKQKFEQNDEYIVDKELIDKVILPLINEKIDFYADLIKSRKEKISRLKEHAVQTFFTSRGTYYLTIDNGNPIILTPEGKTHFVPPGPEERPVYIGVPKKNKELAEKLAREGKAIKITNKELYKIAFPDPQEFFKKFYGMSERAYNWFQKKLKALGFKDYKTGWGEAVSEGVQKVGEVKDPFGGTAKIYKLPDGEYATTFGTKTNIDDYIIFTFFYNHRPTAETLSETLDLIELRNEIKIGILPEEFECWECGIKTHFTEIPHSSIRELREFISERYCNKC